LERICVVHLILTSFLGGPERQILEQARHLDPAIFRTALCAFTGRKPDAPFLAQGRRLGLPTIALPTSGPWDMSTLRRTTRALQRLGADVLVTSGSKANFIGHLAARRVRIPHIIISRGWMSKSLANRLYELADRIMVRFADRVVAPCRAKRRELLRLGVPAGRVVTIYNAARAISPSPLSRAEACAALGVEPDSRVVATMGRLSPEKGQRFFVQAAQQVARDFDDARFVLIGDGPERRRLEQQVRRLGLAERVRFTGHLASVDRLTPHFDLYVHPSLTETIANAIFEAMACARPVVATDVGGTAEVIRNGETGLLVAPGDASGLARAISAMLRDPEAATMGLRGQALVKTQFSFQRLAEGYGALYQEVVRRREQGR